MIPRTAITEWTNTAPWISMQQVEQDLIICRILTVLYNDEFLSSRLAFRGGTALHKLYLTPQPRYSEDIDLVQITADPIGPVIDKLREVLLFMGDPVIKQKSHNNTLIFRVDSTFPPITSLRIKVEINCKEHFSVLGLKSIPFNVTNQWFSGNCQITAYQLDELAGTKLRALYQRKKGRDLFDLNIALKSPEFNPDFAIKCFYKYITFSDKTAPSKTVYLANIEAKMKENEFVNDTQGLLRPSLTFDPDEAFQSVKDKLIEKLI